MEIKRYYKLKQQLEYLEKYNITSFDDIEQEIEIKRSMIICKHTFVTKMS